MLRSFSRLASSALRRALDESVIVVLVVTALVHLVRRNVLDLVLFLGMVLVIVRERMRPAQRGRRELSWPRPLVVSAACVVYGAAMWPLAQGGWPMRVLVALPGLVALSAVLAAGPVATEAKHASPPGRRWWLWVVAGAGAGLFELANFASQRGSPSANPDHPTLTALIDPFFTDPGFRAVFAAVWLATGTWLVHAAVAPLTGPDR